MKKNFIKLLFVAIIIFMGGLFYLRSKQDDAERIHYHAGFIVYINGSRQDYSDYKYMNFVPCSEHDTKKSKEEEQIEKAHLHDGVADVVHVHRSGSVWGDLFKNIKVDLPNNEVKGYVNGVLVENIMKAPIDKNSTAVIVVGDDNTDHSKETVTIEHIQEVESKSELCGSGK